MDCRTAQHLLDFHRTTVPELDQTDRTALESHLAVCAECDALARAERQADEHLGRAIRDVPVPQGLRARLTQRLRAEREAWYRRWAGRVARVAAVAAVVLVAVWLGLGSRSPVTYDPDRIVAAVLDPTKVQWGDHSIVEDWFNKKGITTVAPPNFNYAFLTPPPMLAQFDGREVPCLHFVRVDRETRTSHFVRVYILSTKKFDLTALPPRYTSDSGDLFKLQIWKQPAYAYVILYTGDLDQLLVTKSERDPT